MTDEEAKARWICCPMCDKDRCMKYIANICVYADFEDIVENIDQWLLSHNIV